eukprot:3001827-Pyramimonas_sp.AAC.1
MASEVQSALGLEGCREGPATVTPRSKKSRAAESPPQAPEGGGGLPGLPCAPGRFLRCPTKGCGWSPD